MYVNRVHRSASFDDLSFVKIQCEITFSQIEMVSLKELPVRWYTILTVDKRGLPHRVIRRYKEFEALHEYLVDHFLTQFILCPFPSGDVQHKFKDRLTELQSYLKFVAEHFYCKQLMHWLTI